MGSASLPSRQADREGRGGHWPLPEPPTRAANVMSSSIADRGFPGYKRATVATTNTRTPAFQPDEYPAPAEPLGAFVASLRDGRL